jgi:flagellar hook-associated protein 2
MGNNIISSLGAGSGIDVSGLVDNLVAIEKAPKEERLNSSQEKLETQISAYGVLKSSLSEFQGVLTPLANADTFNARSVSFPDTDVITPNQLDANAQVGTYQIEVLAVAQSQSLASAAIDDPKAALGAGDITIRFGEWDSYTDPSGPPVGFTQNADKDALTLSLDADDSLEDLVSKINDADVGLQASIIQTDGQSQLLLTAPSGAKNAIEITADAALSQFDFNNGSSNLLQTQAAADASLKVNGLEVSRETNDIDDVIQGLSFTLNKQSTDKITFSIGEDKSTAEQAIRDYVEAYNTLYETMKNLTGTTTDEDTEEVSTGGLATDSSAKTMLTQIRQMMTAAVPGIDSGYTALTNVGIRTQIDGSLEIVEDDFDAAIKNNFDLVGTLFASQSSASNSNVSISYGSYVDKAVAGTYDVVVTTEPAKGILNGGSGADFTAVFPLDTGAGDTYSFTINIDGTESNSIVLPNNKTYADQDALAVELQSLINGDSLLKATGAEVDVLYDSTDGRFEFTSRQYGASSSVDFSAASTNMGTLGITDALTGTAGTDAAGTIDGKTAFGSGNVLLPEVDSNPYGLNLTVGSGSLGSSTINFSRGLAGEMSLLIENLLSNAGSIKAREDSINGQLDGIKTDREELDTRMEKVETRLLTQFLAMERVVSSFQTTGNSLDGILDRLPFTYQKS